MSITLPSPDHQLLAYFEADSRYAVVPIPTPVDRTVAEIFAVPRIIRTTPVTGIDRLSRLSIFHELAGTAKSWEAMVSRPAPVAVPDVAKSASAIAALAWIGNPEQLKKASDHYKGLLNVANPDESRDAVAGACLALGPAEGVAGLRTWAGREADRLEAESVKPTSPRPPEALRNLSVKADIIRQFARLDGDRFDREFTIRKNVDAIAAPAERAARLSAIYCETGPESGATLVWWAANIMLRFAHDPEPRTLLIDALLHIARDHAKMDKEHQPELDATRARALRAAFYFRAILQPADQLWIAQQPDPGTDLLVLRPDWKYAAPHAHPGEQ